MFCLRASTASLLLLTVAIALNIAATGEVGVNYGQLGNNLPEPSAVAAALQTMKIGRVRMLEADPDALRAFAYSGIWLTLTVPNGFIPRMASNQTEALRWVGKYVKPFVPKARVCAISVGKEVVSVSPELAEFVVPAMKNMYLALREVGLHHAIAVSTTNSLDVLASAFPPSSGAFRESVVDAVMKPLLAFLAAVNGSFMVNVYPYLVYRADPTIPLGYALFQQDSLGYRDDPATGLRYRNLFDALVDAVVTAIASLGYQDIPVVVTETGWPSAGDPSEQDANLENAALYNARLVKHLLSPPGGTPLRRRGPVETYIFALFDENMREGPASEQHWGLMNPNMTIKYPLDFSRGERHSVFGTLFIIFTSVIAAFLLL